jgi:hypothetical protein
MQGAAIAVSISNYSASVELEARGDGSIELVPNVKHDPATFTSLSDLHMFSQAYGYYGGRRLLMVRAILKINRARELLEGEHCIQVIFQYAWVPRQPCLIKWKRYIWLVVSSLLRLVAIPLRVNLLS